MQGTIVNSPPTFFRAKIPEGLLPGDLFIVHVPNAAPITMAVPPNAKGGSYVDIAAPMETASAPIMIAPGSPEILPDAPVMLDRATTGSAILGGCVGLICCGPLGAILCGGGAYYFSNMHSSEFGARLRGVGLATCNCLVDTQQYVTSTVTSNR